MAIYVVCTCSSVLSLTIIYNDCSKKKLPLNICISYFIFIRVTLDYEVLYFISYLPYVPRVRLKKHLCSSKQSLKYQQSNIFSNFFRFVHVFRECFKSVSYRIAVCYSRRYIEATQSSIWWQCTVLAGAGSKHERRQRKREKERERETQVGDELVV